MQVGETLRWAQQVLRAASDSPASEARVLLADTLATTPAWLAAHDRDNLDADREREFRLRAERRAAGEPLPHILGWWEFYGRRFLVDPSVLIPRPETELLVEHALAALRRRGGQPRVVDVGSGSGCIAITLAAEAPGCRVVATDTSASALRMARRNAERLQVAGRIHLVRAALLDGLRGRWDIVCANLPYIPGDRVEGMAVARHEPRQALDGGLRGTELLLGLVQSLGSQLAVDGTALLELDEGQGHELASTAAGVLGDARVTLIPDLAGRGRLLVIERGRHAG